MKLDEKYGKLTANECTTILNQLIDLDENITTKELTNYLNQRKEKSIAEQKSQTEKFAKELVGKCFKFKFDWREHFYDMIRIDDIYTEFKYGEVQIKLIGYKITVGEKDIRFCELSNDTEWDNFSPNESYKEIELIEFNSIFKKIQDIKDWVINL